MVFRSDAPPPGITGLGVGIIGRVPPPPVGPLGITFGRLPPPPPPPGILGLPGMPGMPGMLGMFGMLGIVGRPPPGAGMTVLLLDPVVLPAPPVVEVPRPPELDVDWPIPGAAVSILGSRLLQLTTPRTRPVATIDDAAALAAFKAIFVIMVKPAGISGPLNYRLLMRNLSANSGKNFRSRDFRLWLRQVGGLKRTVCLCLSDGFRRLLQGAQWRFP